MQWLYPHQTIWRALESSLICHSGRPSIDASPDELTAAGHHEFVSMDRRLLEAATSGDFPSMKQLLALNDPGVLLGATPQGHLYHPGPRGILQGCPDAGSMLFSLSYGRTPSQTKQNLTTTSVTIILEQSILCFILAIFFFFSPFSFSFPFSFTALFVGCVTCVYNKAAARDNRTRNKFLACLASLFSRWVHKPVETPCLFFTCIEENEKLSALKLLDHLLPPCPYTIRPHSAARYYIWVSPFNCFLY